MLISDILLLIVNTLKEKKKISYGRITLILHFTKVDLIKVAHLSMICNRTSYHGPKAGSIDRSHLKISSDRHVAITDCRRLTTSERILMVSC